MGEGRTLVATKVGNELTSNLLVAAVELGDGRRGVRLRLGPRVTTDNSSERKTSWK